MGSKYDSQSILYLLIERVLNRPASFESVPESKIVDVFVSSPLSNSFSFSIVCECLVRLTFECEDFLIRPASKGSSIKEGLVYL